MSNDILSERKMAVERLIKSENGKYLIDYLGDICLSNLGVPCRDAYEYAYNEGKRSVFLAILQFAEKDLSEFIYDKVRNY